MIQALKITSLLLTSVLARMFMFSTENRLSLFSLAHREGYGGKRVSAVRKKEFKKQGLSAPSPSSKTSRQHQLLVDQTRQSQAARKRQGEQSKASCFDHPDKIRYTITHAQSRAAVSLLRLPSERSNWLAAFHRGFALTAVMECQPVSSQQHVCSTPSVPDACCSVRLSGASVCDTSALACSSADWCGWQRKGPLSHRLAARSGEGTAEYACG